VLALWYGLPDDAADPLLAGLTGILSGVLSRPCQDCEGASAFEARAADISHGAIVEKCVGLLSPAAGSGETESVGVKSGRRAVRSFLCAAVSFDASLFGPALYGSLPKDCLRNENFRLVVATLLNSLSQQKCLHVLNSQSELSMCNIEVFVMKNCKHMLHLPSKELEHEVFFQAARVMATLSPTGSESLTKFHEMIPISPRRRPNLHAEKVLFQTLSDILTGQGPAETDVAHGRLLTAFFLRLCAVLPRVLRKKGKSEQDPCFVLNLILAILERKAGAFNFDGEPLENCTKVIGPALLACLKHGINKEENDVAFLSLKFIRVLVAISCPPHSHLSILSEEQIVDPSQIFVFAVSHSKFPQILSAGRENGDDDEKTKLEFIRLLICLCSLGEEIKFDFAVWKSLLVSYTGGVGQADVNLRRLLKLYQSSLNQNGMDNEKIYHDELRWGAGALSSNTPNDSKVYGKWEWFLSSLDLTRIRATVNFFPVWEELVPPPDIAVETWMSGQDIALEVPVDDDADSENVSSSKDAENNNLLDLPQELLNLTKVANQASCEWVGPGQDKRYSPAFILPLILSLLHQFYPPLIKEHQSSRGNKMFTKEDIIIQHEHFVNLVRRILDSGSIALVLSALSSHCGSIRKISVTILGYLLYGLQSNEAAVVAGWRERPQLEMVLDSVRRGILRISSEEKVYVPMLPNVSSSFLARSISIVTKPADPMYASINAYFLRSDDGVFKDTSKLPAFIGLYCSCSSDGQAKRERLWALRFLKDSVVDGYCFKLVIHRQIPFILMNSFDSIMSKGANSKDTSEQVLILEVFERFLSRGGKVVISFLIKQLGFLSWLHGILSSRNIDLSLPSVSLRCTFLSLTKEALGVIVSNIHTFDVKELSDFSHESKLLLRSVASLYERASAEIKSVVSPDGLQKINCDISDICYFTSEILSMTSTESHTEIGIPLSMAIDLLKYFAFSPLLKNSIKSLSKLPFRPVDSSEVVEFCTLILSQSMNLIKKKDLNDNDVQNLLDQIISLSKTFPEIKKSTELLRLVSSIKYMMRMLGQIEQSNHANALLKTTSTLP